MRTILPALFGFLLGASIGEQSAAQDGMLDEFRHEIEAAPSAVLDTARAFAEKTRQEAEAFLRHLDGRATAGHG